MADAYNAATPLDSDRARFGASELRAIKARMDAMVGYNLSGVFSGRNRAVNPRFLFDQEKEGGGYSASGYDVDGWTVAASGTGVILRIRAVNASGKFSRNLQVTTADAALGATDIYTSNHPIEAYNVADFRQGKADASGFTCSFIYNSSIIGNHSIAFQNSGSTRSYVTTFNYAVANVDQLITVNVPGDIAGTWLLDTSGVGLYAILNHGSGSNYVAPVLNAWQAGNYSYAAGAVALISTLNATCILQDFQVEPGIITSRVFENIKVQDQLIYCQRYLEKSYIQGTAVGTLTSLGSRSGVQIVGASLSTAVTDVSFKVTKRIGNPTITVFNTTVANNQIRNLTGATDWSATAINALGDNSFMFTGTTPAGSGVNSQYAYHFRADARM